MAWCPARDGSKTVTGELDSVAKRVLRWLVSGTSDQTESGTGDAFEYAEQNSKDETGCENGGCAMVY